MFDTPSSNTCKHGIDLHEDWCHGCKGSPGTERCSHDGYILISDSILTSMFTATCTKCGARSKEYKQMKRAIDNLKTR